MKQSILPLSSHDELSFCLALLFYHMDPRRGNDSSRKKMTVNIAAFCKFALFVSLPTHEESLFLFHLLLINDHLAKTLGPRALGYPLVKK